MNARARSPSADNSNPCRIRAAAKSWTVRVALLVPVAIAALEAAQLAWPELRESMPAGVYVVGSVLVSALVAALRVRQVAPAAQAGQDEAASLLPGAGEAGGCDTAPKEQPLLQKSNRYRYRYHPRPRKGQPLSQKDKGGGTQ